MPPNWQRQWNGERGLGGVLLAEMCHPLILSGDRSIKPIAASYCSQTVSSVSSLDWSDDSEASLHFPASCISLAATSPKHFPQLPFLYVIALFFRVPCHLHVSISSSHHVSSLSQPFSFWHQCKASIIEWCMGVCVSGIEGLGTPPAPPAEEALTAEHRGLIPPSLHPPTPSSTSLLTSLPPPLTPFPSFVSLFFYLFPVVPHISAQPLDAHIFSYFHIYVCPRLCLRSPISLFSVLFLFSTDSF